jgi:hypothetical protein
LLVLRAAVALAVLVALGAAGCGPTRVAGGPVGPRLSPDEVIRAHNAWADSIQQVWSRAAVGLVVPRGAGRGDIARYDMDGHLFLVKPDRLFLHGQVLGQEVFKMGMDAERFWLWIRPKVNTIWTGRRGGQGERRFILSPADLMMALGVFPVDLSPASPAEFEALPHAYVLTLEWRGGPKRLPLRRIWFDRQTLRPIRVDLFDEGGTRIVMAELLAYGKVGQVDVCTAYRLRFYGDEEVDLVLLLSGVRVDKKIPDAVFEYKVPPDARVEDLDGGNPDVESPGAAEGAGAK